MVLAIFVNNNTRFRGQLDTRAEVHLTEQQKSPTATRIHGPQVQRFHTEPRYCVRVCGLVASPVQPHVVCCPGAEINASRLRLIHGEKSWGGDMAAPSLVTWATPDRIKALDSTVERWQGPITLIIFDEASADTKQKPTVDKNATLQIIFKTVQSWPSSVQVLLLEGMPPAPMSPSEIFYSDPNRIGGFRKHKGNRNQFLQTIPKLTPINALRNMAVDHAQTDWLLYIDADFVPSATLYSYLTSEGMQAARWRDRTAFVIPQFELTPCTSDKNLSAPKNFTDMKNALGSGNVEPFLSSLATVKISDIKETAQKVQKWPSECDNGSTRTLRTDRYPPGVTLNDYRAWLRQASEKGLNRQYAIKPLMHGGPHGSSETLLSWEPYTVLNRSNKWFPRYNEAYAGRFRDKASFCSTLVKTKYQFFGIAGEFLVHMPHKFSNGLRGTRMSKTVMSNRINRDHAAYVFDSERAALDAAFNDVPYPEMFSMNGTSLTFSRS